MGCATDSEFHDLHRTDQFSVRLPDVLCPAALLPRDSAVVSHGMVRGIAGDADFGCFCHSNGGKSLAQPSEHLAHTEHACDCRRGDRATGFPLRRIAWIYAVTCAILCVPHCIDAHLPPAGGSCKACFFLPCICSQIGKREGLKDDAHFQFEKTLGFAKPRVGFATDRAMLLTVVSGATTVVHLLLCQVGCGSAAWVLTPRGRGIGRLVRPRDGWWRISAHGLSVVLRAKDVDGNRRLWQNRREMRRT